HHGPDRRPHPQTKAGNRDHKQAANGSGSGSGSGKESAKGEASGSAAPPRSDRAAVLAGKVKTKRAAKGKKLSGSKTRQNQSTCLGLTVCVLPPARAQIEERAGIDSGLLTCLRWARLNLE